MPAVTEVIARQAGVRFEQLMPETNLADHEVDETELAMISLELEARFDVEIPDSLFSGSLTVWDVAYHLSFLMDAQAGLREQKLGVVIAMPSFSLDNRRHWA